MITSILSQINRPDFPLNWQATEKMPKIAWKTGTSYGRRDAWSIGYNKAYTVGVWVGNFSAEGSPELSGTNTATPLLFKIFNTIDYNNNNDWYAQPNDVDIRQVCAESGLPPGLHCSNLVIDQFIPLISTSKLCEHMQEVKVSPKQDMSYCNVCAPSAGYVNKLYHSLSPEMAAFNEERSIRFERVPTHNPACEKIFRDNGPVIRSPSNGAEYFINPKDPEPILLEASSGNDVTKVYWYVNDKFYKIANRGEKQFFLPPEGPVKISCTDDKGRNRNIRILVRYADL
jgi:penicillin-binding protein 1C